MAQQAAAQELPARPAPRLRAFQLLRRHGQTLCRRTRPVCPTCAIRDGCRFYRMGTGQRPRRGS
jgi:endonuclease III